MKIEQEKPAFDFEAFKTQAIADMKAGKSLVGKDGVFTPLMKQFLEAALEGEMASHMTNCLDNPENENRRNGKTSKLVQSPMGAFESLKLLGIAKEALIPRLLRNAKPY